MRRSTTRPCGHGMAAVHWMWYGRYCVRRDQAMGRAAEHPKGSVTRGMMAAAARSWHTMAVRELINAKAST